MKRAENYYREQDKWDKMSSAQRQEEDRLARLRDTGTGARRNKSGTEYNILTLDYNKSPGGQALSARVSFRTGGKAVGRGRARAWWLRITWLGSAVPRDGAMCAHGIQRFDTGRCSATATWLYSGLRPGKGWVLALPPTRAPCPDPFLLLVLPALCFSLTSILVLICLLRCLDTHLHF